MNSQSALSAADIAFQLNVNYYYSTASFVVLYYDYFLTLSDEIELFWKAKASWVARFFLLTRYLCLLGNIPIALQSYSNWTTERFGVFLSVITICFDVSFALLFPPSCAAFQTYHQVFSVIIQVFVGILLIVRTYALYERNKWVLFILVTTASIVIGTACWAIFGSPKSNPQIFSNFDPNSALGCSPTIDNVDGLRLAISWSGLLLFDSVIVAITVYRGIRIARLKDQNLTTLLIRDGVMYYLVLASANLSNILSFFLGDPFIKGLSTTCANVISVTMLSRLMINLRAFALAEMSKNGSRTLTTFLSFAADTANTAISSTFLTNGDVGSISTDVTSTGIDLEMMTFHRPHAIHFIPP